MEEKSRWQGCSRTYVFGQKMSFTTRLCASFLPNILRLMPDCGTPTTSRNFYMLMRLSVPSVAAVPMALVPSGTGVGCLQKLLVPLNSLLTQVAGFKVKGRLKRRCKDCYFVIRHERHYVICPTHPRHKQMSMKKRDYKSWILTHATQSKERPY